MSASEKLLALRFQPIVYYDDFKFRDGYSKESLQPLLDALPEIVAVVEWAEHIGIYPEWMFIENKVVQEGIVAAVAALEEKLGSKDKPYITSDPMTVSIKKDQA